MTIQQEAELSRLEYLIVKVQARIADRQEEISELQAIATELKAKYEALKKEVT